MIKNLHLQFKFTDRGGRAVYEIFEEYDAKRMLHPVGAIRIEANTDDNNLHSKAEVVWLPLAADTMLWNEEEQLELPLDGSKQQQHLEGDDNE